ncbi:hypothetical protein JST97_00710 [bacterium]|nr:hypothetical protein [bacterium]
MNCEVCGNLLLPDGACRSCSRKPASLVAKLAKAFLVAVPLVALGIYFGGRQLGELARRTGMQWDTEMTGAWVRTDQRVCEIYRIHIVDRQDRALSEKSRTYKPGDRLVANFHTRASKPGRYQPTLLLTGPTPIEPKPGKVIHFTQGEFQEFHSSLISAAIPDGALPGCYVIRLELTGPAGTAFWETDIQVQKS